MRPVRTRRAFGDVLPELLAERGLSLRALARMLDIGDDHLSRVVRGARGKRVTPELARRISVSLDLPADYFVETRLASVVERLECDPDLMDRVYDCLTKKHAARD
jgi:plasmid maintenance system antidote protein VapI